MPLSSQSHKGLQEHNRGELEFEDSDVREMNDYDGGALSGLITRLP